MFKKISNKLENIFDQTPQQPIQTEPALKIQKNDFEIIENNLMLENLSYIFSTDIKADGLRHIFSQLSSYFEAGFLLKKVTPSRDYRIDDCFVFGKKFKTNTDTTPHIRLPSADICRILKTPAHTFLSHFNIASIDTDRKMVSYLIPVTADYSFVMITQIAEPWAKLKIESLQKTLMKIHFSL